jgi:hypothetical protein
MRPYLLLATVGTMLAASCATPIKVTDTTQRARDGVRRSDAREFDQ